MTTAGAAASPPLPTTRPSPSAACPAGFRRSASQDLAVRAPAVHGVPMPVTYTQPNVSTRFSKRPDASAQSPTATHCDADEQETLSSPLLPPALAFAGSGASAAVHDPAESVSTMPSPSPDKSVGMLFLSPDGRRLDRHGAARVVRRVTRRAGSPSPSARIPCATRSSPPPSTPASRFATSRRPPPAPARAPPCATTAPAPAWTGTRLTSPPLTSPGQPGSSRSRPGLRRPGRPWPEAWPARLPGRAPDNDREPPSGEPGPPPAIVSGAAP